jgi:hypothetical protein
MMFSVAHLGQRTLTNPLRWTSSLTMASSSGLPNAESSACWPVARLWMAVHASSMVTIRDPLNSEQEPLSSLRIFFGPRFSENAGPCGFAGRNGRHGGEGSGRVSLGVSASFAKRASADKSASVAFFSASSSLSPACSCCGGLGLRHLLRGGNLQGAAPGRSITHHQGRKPV